MTTLVAENPIAMIKMFSDASDLIQPASEKIDTSQIDLEMYVNIFTAYTNLVG